MITIASKHNKANYLFYIYYEVKRQFFSKNENKIYKKIYKNNQSIIISMLNNSIYYTTKGIYGVKLYTYINDDYITIFKQQLNTLMTNEMMEEVKAFYENVDENIKKHLQFQIYRNCKSIDDEGTCMIWLNVSRNTFIKDIGTVISG